MKKLNILVTGGAGYVGSELIPALIEDGHSVKCLDRFFFGKEFLFSKQFDNLELIQDDIRWFDSKILENIDLVMDLAALSNDPVGDLNPEKTFEINHKGRERVVHLCKENGVSQYILASSASIYGQQKEIVTEESDVNPLTAYSKANRKAEIDNLSLNDDKFTTTALRFSSIYGESPRMRFDTAVNAMVLDLYKKGKITVSGKDNKRPFVFIKDAVRAYLAVIAAPKQKISGEIFNIGSNEQNVTMIDLANQTIDSIGQSCEIVVEGTNDHRSYFASFDKIKNTLNFTTNYSIGDGAKEMYQGLKNKTISDTIKTKTVEWYKYLMSNSEASKNFLINDTLF